MVEASKAGIAIEAGRLPLLPGALALAEGGNFSGGMRRNRRHLDSVFGARLQLDPAVPAALLGLLAEAETSGGLLFSITPGRAGGALETFRAAGERCWEIGEVLDEPVIRVRA